MTCRCEGWRDLGGAWFKTCWPRTAKDSDHWGKRMEVEIRREYPVANPVYPATRPLYYYSLSIYNKGGNKAVSATSGTPLHSLAEAKKKVAELLADECRFRGFSGLRKGRRG